MSNNKNEIQKTNSGNDKSHKSDEITISDVVEDETIKLQPPNDMIVEYKLTICPWCGKDLNCKGFKQNKGEPIRLKCCDHDFIIEIH